MQQILGMLKNHPQNNIHLKPKELFLRGTSTLSSFSIPKWKLQEWIPSKFPFKELFWVWSPQMIAQDNGRAQDQGTALKYPQSTTATATQTIRASFSSLFPTQFEYSGSIFIPLHNESPKLDLCCHQSRIRICTRKQIWSKKIKIKKSWVASPSSAI